MEPGERMRCRRDRGPYCQTVQVVLEERKGSNWDRVGTGESSILSERVVRVVVCDFSESRDEILHIPERSRRPDFGRSYRAKKRETSTA